MRFKSIMLIAGEASGDTLAAELVEALRVELMSRQEASTPDYQPLRARLEPRFFGAGGPRMAAARVDLAADMTAHSIIGLPTLSNYLTFRRLLHRLIRLAKERQPDAIICVDFSVFNRRFAQAIKQYTRSRQDWFHDWGPKIIQYVSPQVWASREGRAYKMARAYDLLLSIFPFEKAWFAERVPQFRVEFVGHPMVDRYRNLLPLPSARAGKDSASPSILLLPGSRPAELRRHLPVIAEAARLIAARKPASFRMVLPHESLLATAQPFQSQVPGLEIQIGNLAKALAQADLALTKSGTVTLECAFFGVPAVVFYKTSTSTYVIGKRLVKVKYLAMPNLLANEPLFPEFVQEAATPENLAAAARELLEDEPHRARVKARLAEVVASLGAPGASHRAAQAIACLLDEPFREG